MTIPLCISCSRSKAVFRPLWQTELTKQTQKMHNWQWNLFCLGNERNSEKLRRATSYQFLGQVSSSSLEWWTAVAILIIPTHFQSSLYGWNMRGVSTLHYPQFNVTPRIYTVCTVMPHSLLQLVLETSQRVDPDGKIKTDQNKYKKTEALSFSG